VRVLAVDAVRVLAVDAAEADGAGELTAVALDVAGERLTVRVRAVPLGAEFLAGCDKPAPKDPGTFELVEVSPAG
jgi:hypothetical protein